MRLSIYVALTLAASSGIVSGQTKIKTGPAIGDSIPAFEANDQQGRKQTLASLTGPKGLMLVFFRSADW